MTSRIVVAVNAIVLPSSLLYCIYQSEGIDFWLTVGFLVGAPLLCVNTYAAFRKREDEAPRITERVLFGVVLVLVLSGGYSLIEIMSKMKP